MMKYSTKIAAIISGAGFIASTLAQLFLFRYSSEQIGLEKIGLIVLLQSILFLTRILEIGVGPNLTRRLAAEKITVESDRFTCELWSTLLAITLPTVLVSALALATIVIWPEIVGKGQNETEVVMISIVLCISGVLGSIVTTLSAAHDGIGNLIARGISLFFFALTVICVGIPLVSRIGPLGYALAVPAGLFVQFLVLIINLVWLGTNLRSSSLSDITFNARHQLRDNLTLNGISICRLLFEPLTKYLLFVLGTLDIVAIFDVLNKIVTAVRTLVSSMMQPLLFQKSQQHAAGISINNFGDQRILYSVAMYLAAGAISSAPIIEELLFNGNTTPYINFIIIALAFSSAINLSGQIAYLNLLAMAAYKNLLQIHIAMVAINLIISIFFGTLYAEKGVVFGYAITMAFGGIALHRLAPRNIDATSNRSVSNTVDIFQLVTLFSIISFNFYLIFSETFNLYWSILLTALLAISFLLTVAKPLLQNR